MIRVTNLSKAYGEQVLFKDVNVTIGAQERVGLIGRNGSGKSTFIRLLMDREQTDGSIDIPSHLIISSLEQHLAFTEPTILAQVCTALPKDSYGEDWKAKSILMGLGFKESDFDRAPGEFSSGFQVRLRLAQALVSDAHLLLLDEPTNYLDITSIRWLERFLKNWQGSFLLVTHDRQFMEEVVTHTIAIHREKMRKMRGGPHKLMEQIKQDEEIYEKTRQNQLKKKEKTEKFIREFRSGARSAGLVQSRIKSLEKQDIGEKLAKIPEIIFHFKSEVVKSNVLLEAHNISFGYHDGNPLFQQLTLSTRPGDRIAVIGPNGRGKSTLLKVMAGKLETQTGNVKAKGDLKLGYFSSESILELRPQLTIMEELRTLPHASEQQLRNLCGSLLFTGDQQKKSISQLSGGEKSRICLGRAMLQESQVLMLDEPTNHLDMESCESLNRALLEYRGALLFVTHDEEMIARLATRLIVFDGGSVSLREQTYPEFLREVGWSEERAEDFRAVQSDSTNKQSYLERKEQQKRLRWLQKEQQKWEKKIEKIEKELSLNADAFQASYLSGDNREIKKLGEERKLLDQQLDTGLAELEKLMDEEGEMEVPL